MSLLLEVTAVGPGFCKSPHSAVGLMGELSRAGCHPPKNLLCRLWVSAGEWGPPTVVHAHRSCKQHTCFPWQVLYWDVWGRVTHTSSWLPSTDGPYGIRLTEIHKLVEIISRKVFLGFSGEPVIWVNLSKCFPFKLSNHPNEIFPKYFYFIILPPNKQQWYNSIWYLVSAYTSKY